MLLTGSRLIRPREKETFFFRVPCVTLREETEWVETGWNTLVGCDPERMVQAAFEARSGAGSVWPYGDGRVAEKVMETMIKLHKGLTL